MSISDSSEGLHISISPPRNIGAAVFFVYIFVFWLAGEYVGLRKIMEDSASLFHWTWLAMWTASAVIFYRFLLFHWGVEQIVARSSTLRVSKKVLGIGREWNYDAKKIRSLRALPELIVSTDTQQFLGASRRTGRIAFNYGNHIVAFARTLSEEEALSIVMRLKEYYPR